MNELNADYRVEELSPEEAGELKLGRADEPACIAEPPDADTAGVPEWYGSVEEGEVGA